MHQLALGESTRLPFIEPLIFCSAPGVRLRLPEPLSLKVFGREPGSDGGVGTAPGIVSTLTDRRVGPASSVPIDANMTRSPLSVSSSGKLEKREFGQRRGPLCCYHSFPTRSRIDPAPPTATAEPAYTVRMVRRIFISHSHEDASKATDIANALTGAGFGPWIDQWEIKPGDSFVARMNEGVANASYLLLLLSKTSVDSRWVTKEWMAAFASEATVIIPIRLDDTQQPALLRDIVYIDMRVDASAGLERLVQFFRRETTEVSPRMRTHQFSLRQASRRQLRLIALACLDDTGLNSFCFDAKLDPRSLTGSSLHERLVYLMHVAASEGLLERFAEWLETEKWKCVSHQAKELADSPAWNWATET